MARTDWYTDRSDGLSTIEIDPSAALIMQITWAGRYNSITSVTPQTPISEGGTVALVVNSFTDAAMTFTVTGSGGKVPIRIAFGGGQFDMLTLRFRSVLT
jgi:hypothetical protein